MLAAESADHLRIRTSLGQSFSSTCQFSSWCLADSNGYDEGGRDPTGGRLAAERAARVCLLASALTPPVRDGSDRMGWPSDGGRADRGR